MLDKLRSGWDWFMVGVIYLVLRVRWIYFHLHPNWNKFWMTEKEAHFIHKYTGELVSDVRMHLTNGKIL